MYRLSVITILMLLSITVAGNLSAQTDLRCNEVLAPVLSAGDSGYVTHIGANNVRAVAGLSGQVVGSIQSGEQFTVLSDPICVDGFFWYQVENENFNGWTAAADGRAHWLLPVIDAPDIDLGQISYLRDIDCQGEDRSVPRALNFSESGAYLAYSCAEFRSIHIYDIENDSIIHEAEFPDRDFVNYLFFVNDDTQLLIVHRDSIALVDIETWQIVAEELAGSLNTPVMLSQNRELFLVADNENYNILHMYDTVTLERLNSLTLSDSIDGVAMDNYNSHILLSIDSEHSSLFILNNNLDVINQIDLNGFFGMISPDMRYAVDSICLFADHGCQRAEMRWYDLNTLQQSFAVPSELGMNRGITFLPDGGSFLVGDCPTIKHVDTETGDILNDDVAPVACLEEYTVSPDWRYLTTEVFEEFDGDIQMNLHLYQIGRN